jgi:hypothetical protein
MDDPTSKKLPDSRPEASLGKHTIDFRRGLREMGKFFRHFGP